MAVEKNTARSVTTDVREGATEEIPECREEGIIKETIGEITGMTAVVPVTRAKGMNLQIPEEAGIMRMIPADAAENRIIAGRRTIR